MASKPYQPIPRRKRRRPETTGRTSNNANHTLPHSSSANTLDRPDCWPQGNAADDVGSGEGAWVTQFVKRLRAEESATVHTPLTSYIDELMVFGAREEYENETWNVPSESASKDFLRTGHFDQPSPPQNSKSVARIMTFPSLPPTSSPAYPLTHPHTHPATLSSSHSSSSLESLTMLRQGRTGRALQSSSKDSVAGSRTRHDTGFSSQALAGASVALEQLLFVINRRVNSLNRRLTGVRSRLASHGFDEDQEFEADAGPAGALGDGRRRRTPLTRLRRQNAALWGSRSQPPDPTGTSSLLEFLSILRPLKLPSEHRISKQMRRSLTRAGQEKETVSNSLPTPLILEEIIDIADAGLVEVESDHSSTEHLMTNVTSIDLSAELSLDLNERLETFKREERRRPSDGETDGGEVGLGAAPRIEEETFPSPALGAEESADDGFGDFGAETGADAISEDEAAGERHAEAERESLINEGNENAIGKTGGEVGEEEADGKILVQEEHESDIKISSIALETSPSILEKRKRSLDTAGDKRGSTLPAFASIEDSITDEIIFLPSIPIRSSDTADRIASRTAYTAACTTMHVSLFWRSTALPARYGLGKSLVGRRLRRPAEKGRSDQLDRPLDGAWGAHTNGVPPPQPTPIIAGGLRQEDEFCGDADDGPLQALMEDDKDDKDDEDDKMGRRGMAAIEERATKVRESGNQVRHTDATEDRARASPLDISSPAVTEDAGSLLRWWASKSSYVTFHQLAEKQSRRTAAKLLMQVLIESTKGSINVKQSHAFADLQISFSGAIT